MGNGKEFVSMRSDEFLKKTFIYSFIYLFEIQTRLENAENIQLIYIITKYVIYIGN